jgi:hypothetical protein
MLNNGRTGLHLRPRHNSLGTNRGTPQLRETPVVAYAFQLHQANESLTHRAHI